MVMLLMLMRVRGMLLKSLVCLVLLVLLLLLVLLHGCRMIRA